MRESTIEKALRIWAVQRSLIVRKFTSPNRRGVTDRVFIGPAGALWLELKAPGKKPEPLQQREIAAINAVGCPSVTAAWADNLESAKNLVSACCLWRELQPDTTP